PPMATFLSLILLLAVLAAIGFVGYRFVVSPALRAVFWRTFAGYFSGVLGYLFIIAFTVAASLTAFNTTFFTANLATLDQLSAGIPVLLLFLIPAITMTAWADERKLGTDELLFTLPAREQDVLLGKYLATFAVYNVALLFSLTNVMVLWAVGSPDPGPVFTAYLGYWLVGGALCAAGLLCSALTSSPAVAFVLGTAVCAIPALIGDLPSSAFGVSLPAGMFRTLSIPEQFRDFALGLIPLSGIVYFVSIAAFCLYANHAAIRRRLWSGARAGMAWQSAVRILSVAAILISLNVLAARTTVRADLTAERVYTLTGTTDAVLGELESEKPVTVQAFVSPEVPRAYAAVRKQLVGLLREFDRRGGDALTVRIVETEPFSDAAEDARAFGIEAREVVTSKEGRAVTEEVFLGLVVTGPGDEVVVPFVGPGVLPEYELTRSIRTASAEERLTVGVLRTDARVMDGQQDWQIVRELELQYDVESVSPDGPIDAEKYDVLLAVAPSSLEEEQATNLLNYLKTGKPALIFDDPYPVALNPAGAISEAPRLPKPRPGGMMAMFNQQPTVPKADDGKLTRILKELGLTWPYDVIVYDPYNPYPQFGDQVNDRYLFVRDRDDTDAAELNPDSPITEGLDQALLFYAGSVSPAAGADKQFTPLLTTGPDNGTIEWDEFGQQSFSPLSGPVIVPVRDPQGERAPQPGVLAARIQREADGDDNGVNAIFVADVDMISDLFFSLRDDPNAVEQGLVFDNIAFVLNAVDVLAGEEEFLPLRRRRTDRRTLIAVEAATARFIEEEREKTEAA
ncbi:MAG: Gldg family protein, partial [Planctomycetota bacterium]